MEKSKFRLADPQTSFEIEPGGKVLSGNGVFLLEETARIKKARQVGILVAVRSDYASTSGEQVSTYVPPIEPESVVQETTKRTKS